MVPSKARTGWDAFEATGRAVSKQTGIAARVDNAHLRGPFWDGIHLASARSGSLSVLYPNLSTSIDGAANCLIGSGASTDPDTARMKAVMELMERYSTTVYDPRDILTARPCDLEVCERVDPRELPPLRAENHGGHVQVRRCHDSVPIRWQRVVELRSGNWLYVPLVLLRTYVPPQTGEDFWIQTSAGVAAHTSRAEAAVSAVLEVLERDAVEAIWQLKLPLAEVSLEGTESIELEQFQIRDKMAFVRQRYFDATSEFSVPIVYAVRETNWPYASDLIVSCACSPDPVAAVLKTRVDASGQHLMRLSESGGLPYTRFVGEPGTPVRDAQASRPDLSFLNSTVQRPLQQWNRHPLDEATFRNHSGASASLSLEWLCSKIESYGHRVYLFDLTAEDVRELGVCVVRAVIPSMLHPTLSRSNVYMQVPRLSQWATRYGVEARQDRTSQQPFC